MMILMMKASLLDAKLWYEVEDGESLFGSFNIPLFNHVTFHTYTLYLNHTSANIV